MELVTLRPRVATPSLVYNRRYACHQLVAGWRAAGEPHPRWAISTDDVDKPFVLTVALSTPQPAAPGWEVVGSRPLLASVPAVGDRVSLSMHVSPSVTRNGKRHPCWYPSAGVAEGDAQPAEAVRSWLEARSARCGIELEDMVLLRRERHEVRRRRDDDALGGGASVVFHSATLSVVARVVDAGAYEGFVRGGLGRQRAYGAGLVIPR